LFFKQFDRRARPGQPPADGQADDPAAGDNDGLIWFNPVQDCASL
jgi:hypothetical protein